MPYIWHQLDRADKIWRMVGPFYAIFANWKYFLCVVTTAAGLFTWQNPELLALIAGMFKQ